jgi:hypothetical protein
MKQARVHVHSKDWLAAEGEEYKSHNDNNIWNIVYILPAGIYAITGPNQRGKGKL